MEPSGIGDIGDTDGLDHISYFLALSEQKRWPHAVCRWSLRGDNVFSKSLPPSRIGLKSITTARTDLSGEGQRAMALAAIHAPKAAHNFQNDPRRPMVVLIHKLPTFF